jgi:hypothetical protein
MEDLRDVGNKVIDNIKKTKPVDAGDLVLGIGEIIESLRRENKDKVDHLEALFNKLVYGTPYELRDEIKEEASSIPVPSGYFAPTQTWASSNIGPSGQRATVMHYNYGSN